VDCAEGLRVQAYFDGELDAQAAAEVEQHLQNCAQCQALIEELEQVRRLLRPHAAPTPVPALLRARITRSLDARPPVRSGPFWIGVLSGVGGSAIAAALAFLLIGSIHNDGLQHELVADHTRSLLSAHLIEVVSTNQHTVKPWFAGRTDVSPVVVDFASQGYQLLGGRIDELDHHRVPVVVYRHGAHFINVFTWAATSGRVPQDTTRNGYHLAFWRDGNLVYCAVADTGWPELQALVGLLRDAGNKLNAP
jgi:anti-sigma factor RsiW